MIEMLMTGGGTTYFPDSGPGGKTLLKGTASAGYFGRVTEAELLPVNDLRTMANLPAGVPSNTGTHGWLKFIFNGKILYISQRVIWNGFITWNMIYNTGMLYGTRGTGLFPVGSGVEQFTPFPVYDGDKTFVVIPRLPTGFNDDPVVNSSAPRDLSEIESLLWRVTTAKTGDWDTLTLTEVDNLLFYSIESYTTATPTQAWAFGLGGLENSVSKSTVSSNYGWRPILELQSADGILLPVINIEGVLDGIRAPLLRQSVEIIPPVISQIQNVSWKNARVNPLAPKATIIGD